MKLIQNIIIIILISINSAFALIDTNADTAIIMDADTGYILYEKNAEKKVFPASMTKIMTSMIVFEKLSNGSLTLDDTFLLVKKLGKNVKDHQCLLRLIKRLGLKIF